MQDKFSIDSHKLMFHPTRVSQWLFSDNNWKKSKDIFPIYVEVSPYGGCNHRCSFCALDFMEYKKIAIDFEVLKNSILNMSQCGVKSIMYAGEGEPLLYKDLDEIIKYSFECGIDNAITTNFVPANEKTIDSFLKYSKWIKVSLNAGSRQNYAKIHKTSEKDFDIVINNLKTAVRLKREKNYNCSLGIQMVLLPENKDEALGLAKLSKDIGIDYIVIKPYSTHPKSYEKEYDNINYNSMLNLKEELDRLNDENFNVIFRVNSLKKEIEQKHSYEKCYSTPYFWAYISSNGDVYGCSVYLNDDRFCYGNIYKNSFREIWQSEKRKKSIDFVANNLDISECRINCRMERINEYLWRLKHPQEHDNFI